METATITRDQLEALLDLKDRAVRRDIDAATCGTRSDWSRAEKAEDELADAIDRLFGSKCDKCPPGGFCELCELLEDE